MRFANVTDLSWDGHSWVGQLVLPSWRGFQTRRGAYGSVSSPEFSDGTVTIVLGPEGRGPEHPNDDEAKALVWLMKNEAAVQRAMLAHLRQRYPSLQERYGYDEADAKRYMPDVNDESDFRSLISLHSVFIHPLQRDDLPYLGFEFGCTWDDEHGLGFMMHGDRVVDCSGADTAFLLWIAEQDAEEA